MDEFLPLCARVAARSAVEDGDVAVPDPFRDPGGGHGAFAVARRGHGEASSSPPRVPAVIHGCEEGDVAVPRGGAEADAASVPAARDARPGAGAATGPGRAERRGRTAAGDVVLLDVRPAGDYRAGHVRGAVRVPVQEPAGRIGGSPGASGNAGCRRGECRVPAHGTGRPLTNRGSRAVRPGDGTPEQRPPEPPADVPGPE
ncbi:rhodanese-like domain-containing protein [Streptomyces sp. NPDC056580]|uniref:rhodanese-like domain-containing protein n=1 Tax=Streptomyces sp. NPDC056580 TaxID=3345872 RepID=UPI003693C618